MRRLSACSGARLAALCTGLALIVAAPVALGADPGELQSRADRLRERGDSFGTQRQSALLHLYALESELQAARAAVSSLDAKRAQVARLHASARRHLAVAERAAEISTRRLEELLRALYEQRGTDPIAILLGSQSLDDALSGLESLDRTAAEQRRILAQARSTRVRLVRLDAQLTAREAELDRLAGEAARRARELEASAAAKAAYVASLRRRQDLTVRQVAALETAARAAQAQAVELRPVSDSRRSPAAVASAPIETAAAADGTRTLTVSAIGYSLPGRTASGLPVGHGIVAVDPSVIPLGTRMYVPGYGAAVAADTGGSIRGAVIDLWFPTTEAAYAWGRRTVVVTLG